MKNIENQQLAPQSGEVVLYNPDDTIRLEVRMNDETVWLTQAQMAELFGKDQSVIARHISNVFKEGEQEKESNMQILHNTLSKYKPTTLYSLDVIISVGYRVKSQRGVLFRKWANSVLREYLLRGYAVNHRFERIEQNMQEHFQKYDDILQDHQNKIDFFVRTSLPPVEGLMHEGQIFDARVCVENLIKQAKREVIMIDGYVDAATFEILDVRQKDVSATIYTERIGESLLRIKELHDSQYPEKIIQLEKYAENFHDRFLIIDYVVYHFGASFKDLGNRLFAFNKMGLDKILILSAVKGKFEKP